MLTVYIPGRERGKRLAFIIRNIKGLTLAIWLLFASLASASWAQSNDGAGDLQQVLGVAPEGEILLTISGELAVRNSERGVQLDQQMLSRLPNQRYETTTIWTKGEQTFTGIMLKELLSWLGAKGSAIRLIALNDYAVTVPLDEIYDEAPLIAYLTNGEAMSVREKGPIWVVYPYDSSDRWRQQTSYARSVWQLSRIEVID